MKIHIGSHTIECSGEAHEGDLQWSSPGYKEVFTGFIGTVSEVSLTRKHAKIYMQDRANFKILRSELPEWLKVGARIEVDLITQKIMLVDND